jgi:hypothetical protein
MKYFCLIFLLFPIALFSQTPAFGKCSKIEANGQPITVDAGHANPSVVDWDGDGLKDLLLGQYGSGKIRFYKNSGTNEAPVFTDFSYLQADGADISLTSG